MGLLRFIFTYDHFLTCCDQVQNAYFDNSPKAPNFFFALSVSRPVFNYKFTSKQEIGGKSRRSIGMAAACQKIEFSDENFADVKFSIPETTSRKALKKGLSILRFSRQVRLFLDLGLTGGFLILKNRLFWPVLA